MKFSLSEDQTLFRTSVERFAGAGDVETRKAARAHPGGIDRVRWRELAQLGLLALTDLSDCAVIAETLGHTLAPAPWLECGFLPMRSTGDAAITDGTRLAAIAFAEPGRRYALDPQLVQAVHTDGAWRVSGAKTFVLGGAAADVLLVTAASADGPVMLLVDANMIERRAYALIDGSVAAEVVLHDTPATLVAGADWPQAVGAARLMAAAETMGLASRLFDETLAYVRQREQFGQPIGRFQAVQHRLVDCYALLEQMRSTLWRAVLAEPSPRWGADIAGAKAFISDGAIHIGEEAIQLHGGMGVTDELVVGHAHKRVLLLSKIFGDPASELGQFARDRRAAA